MRRIRQHLTYSNVMVTILAFVVLTGGDRRRPAGLEHGLYRRHRQ
jgi:hypothetical protein